MRNFLAVVLSTVLTTCYASAEPRVALVIGNAGYDANIGGLSNPANDAKLVAEALKRAGFDVDLETDLNQKAMKRAINRLGGKLVSLGSGTTGLFYYGGHGLQVKGENYLVPLGAEIKTEADADIEGISVSGVLSQMKNAGNAINIIVLDACRNTPVLHVSRGGGRGLAPIHAPTGSFVAYSTAPGEVASDGVAEHSPFAAAFAEEVGSQQSIDKIFIEVRKKVLDATQQKQTPWEQSSLVDKFYFYAPAGMSRPTQTVAVDPKKIELALWNSVADSNDTAQLQSYLTAYPKGRFAGAAKAKIKVLADSRAQTEHHAKPAAYEGVDPKVIELELWKSVANSNDVTQYQSYLSHYPKGFFAQTAHAKIASINEAQKRPKTIIQNQEPSIPVNPAIAGDVQAAITGAKEQGELARMAQMKAKGAAKRAESAAAQARETSKTMNDSNDGSNAAAIAAGAALFSSLLSGSTVKSGVNQDGINWTYAGTSTKGSWDGNGVITWMNGDHYAGEWKRGKREGSGIYIHGNGVRHEGEFDDNEETGVGIDFLPNGDRYEGDFQTGNWTGYGCYYSSNGTVKIGMWQNGNLTGYGAILNAQGAPIQEGSFESGTLKVAAGH